MVYIAILVLGFIVCQYVFIVICLLQLHDRHPRPSALGRRRLRREQRRDPRPERIRQQFLRHGTLLHGSYSASLAAYATVLLGVLSVRVHGLALTVVSPACSCITMHSHVV